MAKKKQKAVELSVIDAKAVEPKVVKPRPFTPRPCSQCEALRQPNTSYSRVYSKHGLIRYCKCDFCGNTWSQYFDNIATGAAIAK